MIERVRLTINGVNSNWRWVAIIAIGLALMSPVAWLGGRALTCADMPGWRGNGACVDADGYHRGGRDD